MLAFATAADLHVAGREVGFNAWTLRQPIYVDVLAMISWLHSLHTSTLSHVTCTLAATVKTNGSLTLRRAGLC